MKLIFIFYLFTILLANLANARTAAEDKLFNAPMPHEALNNKGEQVKVHRSRLEGYLEGKPDNQTRLLELKQEVQKCVAHHRESGAPIKPIEAWPEFLLSMRDDTYSSANRSIRYSSGVAYGFMDINDCSLLEYPNSRAELVSSKGRCTMDLILKTARGVCDANAHSDAVVPPRLPSETELNARMKKMAVDPSTAAMVASAQRLLALTGTRTGEKKTILSLECDIWDQSGILEEATVCLVQGGSFIASPVTGKRGTFNLMLEMRSKYGIKMKAVDAKLDTEVNSGVFAPYLGGGFIIENRPRK